MLRTLLFAAAALAAAAACPAAAEDRCTAILVGAKASTTNAPMTTHTNDCSSCDFRIVKVPARTHAAGARHDVVLASFTYPRYVGSARGSEYLPEKLDKRFYDWPPTPAIGSIPEVNATFAYIDGAYGIINEHQVAIGESTCGARFASKPRSQGGAALFDVAELSRIALQRATTARAAIQIMGDLGVQYGYYGAEWDGDDALAEAGEALTVTDTTEAWMFHILPDDTGASAVWAAQRVPDDHVTAVANQFVIRGVDLTRPDDFMASDNLHAVALRQGLWDNSSAPFDFTRAYAQPRPAGQQHYSTRRVWRVFTLADPALPLPPTTDTFASDYPFSVAPARALSPQDLMRFQRDHYEGTPFDMTAGPAGGPFGDPDRYDAGVRDDLPADDVARGAFERAISIFRASYSFVSVLDPANADNAYIWFGQYAPHATAYAPVYAKVAAVPAPYATGSLFAFDRASSFWVHALVGNWAARFYKYAHPVVAAVQQELEDLVGSMQADLLRQAALVRRDEGEAAMAAFLTEQSALFASQSHATFTTLFEYLVTVLHDGFQVSGLDAERLTVKPLFYPKWWLQQVGYFGNATNASESTGGADVVVGDTMSAVPSVAPAPTSLSPTKTPTPASTLEATVTPAPSPTPTPAPTPAPTTKAPVTTAPMPLPTPSPSPTTTAPTPLPTTATPVTTAPSPLPSATPEPTTTTPVVPPPSSSPLPLPLPSPSPSLSLSPLPLPLPTTEAPARATQPPAATTAQLLPTVLPTTESPAPAAVVSVGNAPADTSLATAHSVSYWTAALFSLLSCAVGVFVGRNVHGRSSGYRPIR